MPPFNPRSLAAKRMDQRRRLKTAMAGLSDKQKRSLKSARKAIENGGGVCMAQHDLSILRFEVPPESELPEQLKADGHRIIYAGSRKRFDGSEYLETLIYQLVLDLPPTDGGGSWHHG